MGCGRCGSCECSSLRWLSRGGFWAGNCCRFEGWSGKGSEFNESSRDAKADKGACADVSGATITVLLGDGYDNNNDDDDDGGGGRR